MLRHPLIARAAAELESLTSLSMVLAPSAMAIDISLRRIGKSYVTSVAIQARLKCTGL